MLFVLSGLSEDKRLIEEINIIYEDGDKVDTVPAIGDCELVVGPMLDPKTDQGQLVLILDIIHERGLIYIRLDDQIMRSSLKWSDKGCTPWLPRLAL